MAEESKESTQFNAKIVGVLTALVTSAITVPTTYFIQAYLERDRVSIEAVEGDYYWTNYQADAGKFRQLLQDRGEYYKNEFSIWLNDQDESVIALLKETFFDDAGREKLMMAMKEAKDYLEERSAKIKAFRSRWNQDRNERRLSGLLQDAMSLRIIRDNAPPPSPGDVDAAALKKLKDIDRLKVIVSDVGMDAKNFKPSRTGNVTVLATLVNAGNTDGLIKAWGYFEVPQLRVKLPIIESGAKAQKIEKRSVKALQFEVDYPRADAEALGSLRSAVKDGKQLVGSLELTDFRGSKIHWSKVEFPNGTLKP